MKVILVWGEEKNVVRDAYDRPVVVDRGMYDPRWGSALPLVMTPADVSRIQAMTQVPYALAIRMGLISVE